MHSGSAGTKKPALCRYWAAKKTCFYGNECQFMHADPNSPYGRSPTADNSFGGGHISQDLAAMDLADPHMAPDHFFTAPFDIDNDNFGGSTSKFQHFMQRSQSVGTGLSHYSDELRHHQEEDGRRPMFGQMSPQGANAESRMSANFGGMKISPPNDVGMQFYPGARNTGTIKEFTPRNHNANTGPNSAEFLPNVRNVADFKQGGPQANDLISKIPEFVPRSMAPPGNGMMNDSGGMRGTNNNSAALAPHNSGGMNDHYNSGSLSAGASPLQSPGNSPSMRRKGQPPPLDISSAQANFPGAMVQENIGGTTYFYTEDQVQPTMPRTVYPNFHMYQSMPAHVAYMKPKPNAPSFFVGEELKVEIYNKRSVSMAQVDPAEHPDIPREVDKYHTLFPLEPPPKSPMEKSSTFGYTTTCYKAINKKDNKLYCLRRIHGFRMTNTQWMVLVDKWKKLQHSNIVTLREVFSTKAFGEHSTVFVHDYHPTALTMMHRHFTGPGAQASNGFSGGSNSFNKGQHHKGGFMGPQGPHHTGVNGPQQRTGLLPESLIWTYVVQLSSALRTIHAAGLACRVMDPTKILVTGKSRLRVNCVGIFDVLTFDGGNNPLAMISHYQQEDLVSLGKVVLVLACNSVQSIQRQHIQGSLELVAHNFSSDLKNLILYLLTTQPRPRSVNDIMPMIGARFYTQLDAAQMRGDVLEEEVAKEVGNGRQFRLLCKLGVMNERPEFNGDPTWAETGDRYLLKLYRDYLFHQVSSDSTPWIDMAHIVQSLNKLDAGVPEKVTLMSRDEQNILVVSYADLKRCFETTFEEIQQSQNAPVEEVPQ
ncbi:PAN2-PAN3 deadenylation complex subunit pan3-like isoform X2 [Patiria miniata]|uniref:PAN2-PAN3 deadenylation complex subunit PAN3 n=1 Tax=Patiria miniata TaxID=46514 RepID=A0A913ZWT5_PATMI|nr:PAN2-PAN3 deadenylation complex subunit pan3-like isoform X2 [Patiria miniata]